MATTRRRPLLNSYGMSADDAVRIVREKRSPACLCNRAFEDNLRTCGADPPVKNSATEGA